jgi:SulP family sulfate permease
MRYRRSGIGKELLDFFKESVTQINPKDNFKGIFSNWKKDLMAGVTVAFIALPLALAFGVGSGLGAMSGLWGAIAGGLLGSLFGGSKIGVSGPTGPKMAQLAVIMLGYQLADGTPDITYAFTIIFLSGAILAALSFLKIGRLIYYTPYSVIAGFMCGIGVLVIILEIDPLLGVPNAKNVMDVIKTLPYALSHFKPHSLELSLATLALLFAYPKIIKKLNFLKAIPATLFVLVVASLTANLAGLNVDYIGDIPVGLPDLTMPDFSKYAFSQYLFPALSLAGLAIFDSLLTCLVNDNLSGEKHNSDRELFGQGIANMFAGMVGGLTTATATMRSVALYKSGGRTVLASFTHGVVLLSIAVFFGPIAAKIPLPCLAAILLKVGIDIIDYRVLPITHKLPLSDLIVFITVFFVTVFEDLLIAMGIGMALACFRFVQEITKVYKYELDKNVSEKNIQETNGVVNFSPKGPLFFGSVQKINEVLNNVENKKTIRINLSEVVFIDLSGAFALDDAIQNFREKGIEVEIYSPNDDINKVLGKLNLYKKWQDDLAARILLVV